MIVRAKITDYENSDWYLMVSHNSKKTVLPIKKDNDYEVHALTINDNGICKVLLLVGEAIASALPLFLFDIFDFSIPDDWVCKVFNDHIRVIYGPEIISKSPEAYSRIWDGEDYPEPMRTLMQRAEIRKLAYLDNSKPPANLLADHWVMCPICTESWEDTLGYPMVKCPNCEEVLRNPIAREK